MDKLSDFLWHDVHQCAALNHGSFVFSGTSWDVVTMRCRVRRWLMRQHKQNDDSKIGRLLRQVVPNGHMHVCMWLMMWYTERGLPPCQLLWFAVKHNNVMACQWLAEHTPFDLFFHHDRWQLCLALNVAAKAGNLQICQWLTHRFSFTVREARENKNMALRSAAENGHLHVCQWLTDHFGLDVFDARSWGGFVVGAPTRERMYHRTLTRTAIRGHLDVCKWLAQRFQLEPWDARDYDNHALRWSARYGHLNVCQWLAQHFGLDAKDARSCNNSALQLATMCGHMDVKDWLIDYFQLTEHDIFESENSTPPQCDDNGDKLPLNWHLIPTNT